MAQLTPEAIREAQVRIKTFMKVHKSSSHEERTEAITIVLDHLGLSQALKDELLVTFDKIGLTPYGYGQAMYGALVILYAYDSLEN
jgi:hypothetical protein